MTTEGIDMTEELAFRIHTTLEHQRVYCDKHDDGVWLSMSIRGASCYVTITKDQAKVLADGLQKIIDSEEA
jgi:hypothetical protein